MRFLAFPLVAAGVLIVVVKTPSHSRPPVEATALRCTMAQGRTLAMVRVERDTTLPFASTQVAPTSMSSVRPSGMDSLLAIPGTPMPAARVRLLQLDPATRDILSRAGVTDSQPSAFIRAAPYRADCRTIRWTDTLPWVVTGDVSFMRATLETRERWIGGVPVFVIPHAWNYPYPRQRSLALLTPREAPLTPADAMYSLHVAFEFPVAVRDTALRSRALTWARGNLAAADLEPARSIIWDAVLTPDRETMRPMPSRLRGTYRVTVESGDVRGTWLFRTYDTRKYRWREGENARSIADLLASPHPAGYQLVGFAAPTREALPEVHLRGSPEPDGPSVLLSAADRPTAPGNDARWAFAGTLEFVLRAAPEQLWDDLEAFVPPPTAEDSFLLMMSIRIGMAPTVRGDRQPRLPLTLRIDEKGMVRADTNLTKDGRRLRVSLERVDTVSVKWPW
jgi:hypothetical protein